MGFNIAIDGPSGAGKSTLSKKVAAALGFMYVDTGAIYRTIGLAAYRAGIDPENIDEITVMINSINIDVKFFDGAQHVYLNDEDVSDDIREHIISEYASKTSAIPSVREFLLEMQRKLARENDTIMDGRDIGTVVLPDADVKIFLTASAQARAKRRYLELAEKKQDVPYDVVLKDIIERDKRDTMRKIAPLKAADDAITVDTTELDFEGSYRQLLKVIKDNMS